MSSPNATLPRADPTAQAGVVIDRDAKSLHVRIPPTRRIRDLPIGYKIGVPYLFVCTIGITIVAIFGRADSGPVAAANAAFYAGILGLVFWFAVRRFRVHSMIEVNGNSLSITELAGKRPLRTRTWPRTLIAIVKRNPSNGTLLIHIVGRAFVELFVGPNVKVTENVAREISEALQSLPLVQEGPVAAEHLDDGSRGLPRGRARTALLTVSLLLGAAGVVMTFFGFPWTVLSVYVFIFAVAPVGIALGTKERDYYFF